MRGTRREMMLGAATLALLGRGGTARAATALATALPRTARPLPLADVRLRASDYANAVEVNRAYLLRLSADRLLHNFRLYAGLPPKGEVYGGWESDTIAGHTLGHYMSALVRMHEQTGDAGVRARADYIVDELAVAQKARGNGYIGAMQRKRKDGTIVDAIEIFPEIMKGDIRSGGFDLNGAWSPFYTVHKLYAGLLDIHESWGNPEALAVLVAFSGYFEPVFAALSDAQMQEMLGTEYGGLNESYAELFARTGDRKYLAIAERLYDRKVLDPLENREDKLGNLHANTQVPKLIGLARIHDLTGEPAKATAAQFFWQAVTQHHSYVIGGNADREYFSAPDTIATHITEQTCEHCNTYNMLKLTRQLYSWAPDGALFDYYERAHLNHVMAAQDPKTAGFTYMTPLLTGAKRDYSTPADDAFWCCVGTGMESHAKHGESIFWEGDAGATRSGGAKALLVNLYIPAEATWKARDAALLLDTRYPFEGASTLTLAKLGKPGTFPIALRVPGWAAGKAIVTVNDRPVTPTLARGYAVVERRWQAGDRIAITLPLELRIEPTPGDDTTIAILRGPMVMAADLGTIAGDWSSPDPALVGDDLLARFTASAQPATYTTSGIARPADLTFVPFYRQYERRSAVYFKRFSESAWKTEQAAFIADQARRKDIAARSVDVVHLGEMQPEHDHGLTSDLSYPVSYRNRNGRDARSGGFFEFTVKAKPGPLVLQATYWGDERPTDFDIMVDNVKVATQHLGGDRPGRFMDIDYPLPIGLTQGKSQLKIRFVPHAKHTAGPVFGVVLFSAGPAA